MASGNILTYGNVFNRPLNRNAVVIVWHLITKRKQIADSFIIIRKMLTNVDSFHQRQIRDPIYGQLVIGPPGSGKTTYCHKVNEFYKELDRKVAVVNLDPANEQMCYDAQIDVVSIRFNQQPKGELFLNIVSDETNNRGRCDATSEAWTEWRFGLLHRIFRGKFRLVVEPIEEQLSKLFHIRLPRSSGTLYTSRINDTDFQSPKYIGLSFVHRSPDRFPLLFGANEIHINITFVIKHNATNGFAARECVE